jgi:phage baseplate assembly protein W
MATYVGFSTQNLDKVRELFKPGIDFGDGIVPQPSKISKKYRLSDEQLVINDFINALNIPQGQKVGRPEYGTTLWSFVFEPNTTDVRVQLEAEVRRMAEMDPRIILNSVQAFPQDNGVLLEVELAISPFNNPMTMSIMFDQATSTAFST